MGAGYDYIVVGAGSSGAVVAARLSEDPACRVLLIEAGGPNRHPLQLMPLAFPRVALGRIGTWQFESEPEPALGGRRLGIPRGRTLGGTSSVNAMIAVRGNRRDFDDWATAGCEGWAFADVLPYFRKLESHWRGESEWHGGTGPVGISRMQGPDLLFEAHRAACEAAGIPYCEDPNGAEQDGISHMESTVSQGRRASSYRAYLHPARRRPNLTTLTGAQVTRIVVERGRATGVEIARNGATQRIHASNEVVLSAGAYGSPQVLMLSGIGNADELRAMGIKPVHALPGVGRQLADHPVVIQEYALKQDLGLTRHLRMDRAAVAAARWFLTGGGPFSYTGTLANAFLRSDPAADRPDVQMMFLPMSGDARLWVPGLQRRSPPRLSVRTGYLPLKSRGWVKLASSDPRAAPRIFLNMFSAPGDMDGMVRSIRITRDIYAREPLARLIAHEHLPGADLQSDAQLEAFVRANATHRAHPAGSCRIGVDDQAVVDPQLRLRGLDGLRVVDASVMPALPRGNPNLACLMIGEKAADMIRAATGAA
ncbi:MAG: GMC family oxidoreductase N-terminal domain-containing protein [Erythrobacter sp.]|nr:GMC family oxidoreductase N-terminal domain-containing protein [Erythrobacter sp.]